MDDVRRPDAIGPGLALEDLTVGMTASYRHTVTAADVQAFADVSGDHNPVHLDEDFARTTRFNGRIAHGMLSASFVSTTIASRLPGPGTIYLSQNLVFRAPVRIGDTVEVRVEVVELVPERHRARLACTCTVAGEVVLDGEATVKVPTRADSPPLL